MLKFYNERSIIPLGLFLIISNGPPNVPGSMRVTVAYNNSVAVMRVGEFIIFPGQMYLLILLYIMYLTFPGQMILLLLMYILILLYIINYVF